MGRLQVNSNLSKNNKILLNKPNQTILKPHSMFSPAITYGNPYIFKGGTPNTISTVFDYLQFQIGSPSTADIITIGFKNPITESYTFSQFYYSSTLNRWTRNFLFNPDATNTVLTLDAIIRINLRDTYKEILIPSGSIIQKLNNGKVFLNKI